MSQPQLRVAVAGTGLSGTAHCRAVHLSGAKLVGVLASTPERGRAAAARLNAQRAFATFDELAQDDIDVVHVCLPDELHAEAALTSFAAGKHVVCEKPLSLDGESADSMLDARTSSGKLGFVPFVYRYYPIAQELRSRVHAGELGHIHLVHGAYLQDWLACEQDTDWRVRPGSGASRAFADIGSHWVDLVEFVLGQRIRRISARMSQAFANRPSPNAGLGGNGLFSRISHVGNEDVAVVHLETDSGALGSVVISQVSPGRKNALILELSGSTASARFEQERPDLLWVGRQKAASSIITSDPAHLSPAAARVARLPPGHPHGWLDCVDRFVADAYAVIGGEQLDGVPSFEDGRRAVALTEAAVESSIGGGEWIEVQEGAPSPA